MKDEEAHDTEAITASPDQLPTPALSPITEHGLEKAVTDHHHLTKEPSAMATPTLADAPLRANVSNARLNSPSTFKLSPAQMVELTSSPDSLPLRPVTSVIDDMPPLTDENRSKTIASTGLGIAALDNPLSDDSFPELSPIQILNAHSPTSILNAHSPTPIQDAHSSTPVQNAHSPTPVQNAHSPTPIQNAHSPTPVQTGFASAVSTSVGRPAPSARSSSTPVLRRKTHASTQVPRNPAEHRESSRPRRPTLTLKSTDRSERSPDPLKPSPIPDSYPSPMPSAIPLPPLSLPTYLQLELSSERPSALYIHRSASSDFPYESSKVKFERLLNFLLLPPQLEQTLLFGALACLDAWLYTFTILPLRFLKAIAILLQWWGQSMVKEAKDIASFIYVGLGRVWQRRKQQAASVDPSQSSSFGEPSNTPAAAAAGPSPRLDGGQFDGADMKFQQPPPRSRKPNSSYRHRRSKSVPSALLPNHKADILHGLLIIISCLILVRFDASRMYHKIRGQAAIKLYVIYNVLEVFDRLFSALGQDVIECLFSKETLERKPNGRSKILRPFGMFALALLYNVVHAAALFYQVITLNVAVNSYSNALLTLLMSNQFVEIKGTVFKKFEKENLFQLTCADVVERFQLWLMLLIIALRNIVEIGGLSMSFEPGGTTTTNFQPNTTASPVQSTSFLPQAFTMFPKGLGQIFGPFLIVLGSEMLVDWLKHAYISKFNSIKPNIYGRFLDVLTKDYYSHAFADQNLTKRLGLPVLPLSCLFIRASVQTYHMFIATHMPLPIASTATSLAVESASAETSPSTTAALAHIDHIFRRALGRSSFGAGADAITGAQSWRFWTLDDAIALGTMIVFFLIIYMFLLVLKLLLGMVLLAFSRKRYRAMKTQEREKENYDTQGRRVGGWGSVEVGEDKRRWIYEDDAEGLRNLREREAKGKEKAKGELRLDGIGRYMMAAKRIW